MSDTKVYDNDNPRIVSRGELLAAGLEYVGRNESFEIPQVWEQFTRRLSELEALRAPNGLVLGIAKEGPEPGVYDYLAAVEVTTLVGLPEGMAGWVIPAQDYAVFWVDSETGQTRPSTVRDVEQFAHLCELLANIDTIGIPVMPQDVPDPKATLLYGVQACITHSRKPIFWSTDRPEVNCAIIRMLASAFRGDITSQAYGITQVSPTSPLWWRNCILL